MSVPLFINEFRDSIIKNQPYKLWNNSNPTSDLLQATHIAFQGPKRKLLEESGYKTYECPTILFFYENRNHDHPKYLQICSSVDFKGKQMESVAFMDRKDLLDYLQGNTSTSVNIKTLKKDAVDSSVFGFDLDSKRKLVPENVKQDLEFVKKIKSLQRCVNTAESVLCVVGNRGFANVEKDAIPKFNANFKNSRAKPSKHASKSDKKSILPIIVVPAAAQSLLTLLNVKEFLIDEKLS